MEKLYIPLLNSIYNKITCHFNRDLRLVLIAMCIAVMNGFLFFGFSPSELNAVKCETMNAVLISLITIFSLNGNLKSIEWNKAVYYPFVFFGFIVLVISFIHRTGLVLLAIEYILLLPALYCVWLNREDTYVLFNITSITIVLEGFIHFVYCFFLSEQAKAFIVSDRYAGNAGGPNQFGEIGAVIFIAGLYIFIAYRKGIAGCILSSTGIGIGISYILVSSCRTAMLAEIVCILSAVIYSIKLYIIRKDFTKKRLVHAIVAVLLTGGIIFTGQQLDNIYYKSLQRQNEVTYSSELEQDNSDAAEEITEAEQPEDLPEENNTTSISDRFSFNGDINALSSGRIAIWKFYIDHFSPWGHDDFCEPGKSVEDKVYPLPAHNNIIEYTYRCGYLAGGIYLVLFIAIGISGLRMLFLRKHAEYYKILCIMCIAAFSVYALIEWSHILTRPVTCLYHLALIPIMGDAKRLSQGS